MARATRSSGREKADKRTVLPVLPVRDTVHFPRIINTLHVARKGSLTALRQALAGEGQVLVLAQRDMSIEEPSANDLHRIGTVSEALQGIPLPDGSVRAVLRGVDRMRVVRISRRAGVLWAEVEPMVERADASPATEALMRECVESFARVIELGQRVPPEAMEEVAHEERPGVLADLIAHHLPLWPAQKQQLLEETNVKNRLEAIFNFLVKEQHVLELQAEVHQNADRQIASSQREFLLREQLKAIQAELGGTETFSQEIEDYVRRIEEAKLPEDAAAKARSEIRRLERMTETSPESSLIRTYLDTLLSMPWNERTEDFLHVEEAEKILDQGHFGLDKVKDRVLDYLAVRQLSRDLRGPILCFLGPPGVGKTSIGKSIADALNRKFYSLSLGGLRDEAEIRGHRRTYIGAMPGRILQGLKTVGVKNPVFMLDEIDKLASDFRGDPASALLEALDPEQNYHFSDHYLDTPFDVSEVIFIATANSLDRIPWALRDRLEFIEFSSYTDEERFRIARDYVLAKALREHGLTDRLTIEDEALQDLVQNYTREAGVRALQKHIATICRKAARKIAGGSTEQFNVQASDLPSMLGASIRTSRTPQKGEIGTATGLVYTEYGGDVVPVEASLLPPTGDQVQIRLTGNLGDVMKESAEAAWTFVRSIQSRLTSRTGPQEVHVHVPEGAVPKDGPSAGIVMAIALASAMSGRAVKTGFAFTGEITLRGRILPIGGLREKLLAAARDGYTDVIIPSANEQDLDEVPKHVRESLCIHLIEKADQALDLALEPVQQSAVTMSQ